MNDILISYIIRDTDKLQLYSGDLMEAIDKLEKESRHFYHFSFSDAKSKDDPWVYGKKLNGWLEWTSGYDLPDAIKNQYVFHGSYSWHYLYQSTRVECGTSKSQTVEELLLDLSENSVISYIHIGDLKFVWDN